MTEPRIAPGEAAFRIVDGGASRVLIVADHASNRIPPGIDLGLAPELLDDHIAVDLGVETLATTLAHRLACRAVLGNVSRLVCDLNRDPQADALVPRRSDGIEIPGNAEADRAARITRFHQPYHAEVARQVAMIDMPLLISLHSFTPTLRERPEERRPWDVGVLYNQDHRAAALAIDALRAHGLTVGDQQPYSGRDLNYTMDRHAEAQGIPYLGIEIRQDIVAQFIDGDHRESLVAAIERCRDLIF